MIVWGINEGRGAAAEVDEWLTESHTTRLPVAGGFRNRIHRAPQDSAKIVEVSA